MGYMGSTPGPGIIWITPKSGHTHARWTRVDRLIRGSLPKSKPSLSKKGRLPPIWSTPGAGVHPTALIGLVISSRLALDDATQRSTASADGRAVPDSGFGSTGVGIVADRWRKSIHSSEKRAARWAEQEKRSAIVYFVNTIGIALAASASPCL